MNEFDIKTATHLPQGQKIILKGITGSQAYGLATPESDEDRQGIYVEPTTHVLGRMALSDAPKLSITNTDPDYAFHEVMKACRLMMKCNPTVTDVLWLKDYEVLTPEGKLLVANRRSFLSDKAVRASYIGYAVAQARKLEAREAEGLVGFGPALKSRAPKHKRHLFRLCLQCEQLLDTGEIVLDCSEHRDEIFEFGERPSEYVIAWFENKRAELDAMDSVLYGEPDVEAIEWVLNQIRRRN